MDMEVPATPQKQGRFTSLDQQPTPPPTVVSKKLILVVKHQADDGSITRRRLEWESLDTTLRDSGVEQRHGAQLLDGPIQHQLSGARDYESDDDVSRWLCSAKDRDQQRRRFRGFLHSLWPSNDEFNAARNPFYDPDEDGPYEEFLKYGIWDGHCPYDDDDYNPTTDPNRSTDVVMPEIGDEGIENEHDLHMIMKARQEHQVRSEAFNKRRGQVIAKQKRAGLSYAEMDLTEIFFGPEIESGDSGSDSESETDYAEKEAKPQTYSTAGDSERPEEFTTPPTLVVKARCFGGQAPRTGRGRPKGTQDKKKRKRRSKLNPDSVYKFKGDSEDERPVRKKGKKGHAGAFVDTDEWKAQTRAGARRDRCTTVHGGLDGSYDDRTTASKPDPADTMAGSIAPAHNSPPGASDKLKKASRQLSVLTAIISG
ncbi:hypothetical protein F4802DRAFT_204472 [Xylaria palmicola]|nr:hypothetical protein F4802DRAFT_204472 [Xylaria palmicola]